MLTLPPPPLPPLCPPLQLMDTPFKPVHSMVPVEVHIPSFSRDLVFQHAELLPGLDMRYFVHKDVPPYVLTDGNWCVPCSRRECAQLPFSELIAPPPLLPPGCDAPFLQS